MTIPGIDMVVAVGLMAAIGNIERFDKPDRLAAYIGLNPSVHQSGDGPAYHGRITKRGRSNARHLLVEAAWQTALLPDRSAPSIKECGPDAAITLPLSPLARKLTVIIWHLLTKGEDYAWVRPALHAKKIRDLELRAGHPERRGQRGRSYDYNVADRRREDRARGEQAEKTIPG